MPNVFIAGVTGYLGSRLADVSVAHPAPAMEGLHRGAHAL